MSMGAISPVEIIIVYFIILVIIYFVHRKNNKNNKSPKIWVAIILSLISIPPIGGILYAKGIIIASILYLPTILLFIYIPDSRVISALIFAAISGYISYRQNRSIKE